ncbi:MAG: DUF1571 domain-containing protein [Nitrospirae bacterium]|nr:DUF1571 domain-containing protein [Nitrospirota bacterium]MCL5979024.1 DUF1571 domain-containing protein [Nitrospirota bacterium]
MVLAFALLLALMPSQDIIPASIENYNSVESYSVTLRSRSDDSSEEIRYYYKKPGFVRMEFVKPYKGAMLVYSPSKKEARLRPFGFFKSFILTLSPDNSLIKSSKGHRVDESDIGALLKVVKKLQYNGKTEISGEESVGNRPVIVVSVKGEKDFAVNGIHRYILWLDKKTFLPLKVAAYDMQGELMEEVLMDDLKINIGITEDFFEL